jgi:hypothetical protein
MLVFVDDAAESVAAADVHAGETVRIGSRWRDRAQGRSLTYRLVGTVLVVVELELVQVVA